MIARVHDARLSVDERIMEREMKRFFARQRKVAVAKAQGPHAKARVAAGTLVASDVFNQHQWNEQLREDMPDLLAGIVATWGQATLDAIAPSEKTASESLETKADEPQISFDVTDPRVTALVNTQVDRLVGVNQTTIDALRKAISEGLANGETVREIAKRIRDVFDTASASRALLIARTETLSAANGGLLIGAQQSGVVSQKNWLNAGDGRVRAHHQGVSSVAVTDPFYVGGHQMQHPGDPAGPAAEVVNCRCTMTFGTLLSAPFGALTFTE